MYFNIEIKCWLFLLKLTLINIILSNEKDITIFEVKTIRINLFY